MSENEAKNELPKLDQNAASRYRLLALARRLTYGHGVTGCCMHMVDLSQPVSVRYSDERKRASASNVQTCKSVWSCPVCADRITRERAAELLRGMDNWTAAGNTVAMATYTLAHKEFERSKVVLDRLMLAFNKFKSGRAYQSLKESMNIEGSVRALEVTFGVAGWHWHIHELYFLRGKTARRHAQMLSALRGRWGECVVAAGGHVVPKGFDLSKETAASFDYVTKFGAAGQREVWGLAHEVVRSPAKGAGKGIHPFQLLALCESRKSYVPLWNEFVQSSKRVQQLRYSVGLKDAIGIDDKTDAELADAELQAANRTLALLPRGAWYYLNTRDPKIIGEFWQVAAAGDSDLLLAWCEGNEVIAYPAIVDTSTN